MQQPQASKPGGQTRLGVVDRGSLLDIRGFESLLLRQYPV
jgi:hypothetical protein